MAHDETEFDKLLREAREWEARDRARQKSLGMKDESGGETFPPASRAPSATIGELEKKAAAELGTKGEPPSMAPTPKPEAPASAGAAWGALKEAMKQAQAQAQARQAQAQSRTTRVRRKGGWGWIWVLILLYFIFRHFVR